MLLLSRGAGIGEAEAPQGEMGQSPQRVGQYSSRQAFQGISIERVSIVVFVYLLVRPRASIIPLIETCVVLNSTDEDAGCGDISLHLGVPHWRFS
jgi:hypothetical protein